MTAVPDPSTPAKNPWEAVKRKFYPAHGSGFIMYYDVAEVDTARQGEAAAHQHAIKTLRAELDTVRRIAQECKLRDLPTAQAALTEAQAEITRLNDIISNRRNIE